MESTRLPVRDHEGIVCQRCVGWRRDFQGGAFFFELILCFQHHADACDGFGQFTIGEPPLKGLAPHEA